MKDVIIICLIGYILYDRYIREKDIELLKSDIKKLTDKAESFLNKENE
jgi:hypothetical protein